MIRGEKPPPGHGSWRIGPVPKKPGRQAVSHRATPFRPPKQVAEWGLFPEKYSLFGNLAAPFGGMGSKEIERIDCIAKPHTRHLNSDGGPTFAEVGRRWPWLTRIGGGQSSSVQVAVASAHWLTHPAKWLQLAFQALLAEFSFPNGFRFEKPSSRGESMGRISFRLMLARAG